MVEKRYFLKLSGAVLLGLVALIITGIIFWLSFPYLITIFVGAVLLTVAFLITWIIIYVAAVIGVAIYYFFKPMRVSKKDKGYSIDKAKESGRRSKGKS